MAVRTRSEGSEHRLGFSRRRRVPKYRREVLVIATEATEVMTTILDLRINSLAAMARALGRSQPLAWAARDRRTGGPRRGPGGDGVDQSPWNRALGSCGPSSTSVTWDPRRCAGPGTRSTCIQPDSNLGLVVDELQTWTASIRDPHCPTFERELLDGLGKGSSLGAPIIVDGQLWGEFYATRQVGRTPFSDTDGFYVQALTAILAGAISRWVREESLELLAYRDPLTGLLNRRAFDHQAAQAFDVPAGTSRSVTVVAVDINRLKQVNDTLGHGAGDQLIQSVARSMLRTFGRLPGSLVARVGGDEFAVLVSGHAACNGSSRPPTACAGNATSSDSSSAYHRGRQRRSSPASPL